MFYKAIIYISHEIGKMSTIHIKKLYLSSGVKERKLWREGAKHHVLALAARKQRTLLLKT